MNKHKPLWKQQIHQLYEQYYKGKTQNAPMVNDRGKGRCVVCGKLRKLGQRGTAKGKCKKCRKGAK